MYIINLILMRQSLWPGALHTRPWRGLPTSKGTGHRAVSVRPETGMVTAKRN
jgi:hypothetical protein